MRLIRPRSVKTLVKIPIFAFGGAVVLMLGYIGAHELTAYTDSPAFCGGICHEAMSPEFTTHEVSPHSTVACSDCHVGAGALNMITSKLNSARDVLSTITRDYARPITTPIKSLRPASDTCERCHWPEKFAGDLVRTRTRYDSDEANTRSIDTRVLKVGGGEAEVAVGIHWHSTAEVWYVPLDEKRLDIVWVGVQNGGEYTTEYIDPTRPRLAPERIQSEARLMDCVDCHNRVTHLFRSPDDLVDSALADGSIDDSLPFIKREAVKALDPPNPSLKQARSKVSAIEDFYEVSYPEVHAGKKGEIDDALDKLEEIVKLTTFPDMKVDWNTHLDQLGHEKPPEDMQVDWDNFANRGESPGCFRCHGRLVAAGGGNNLRLDADCSLCHYTLESPPVTKLVPTTPHPVGGLDNCLLCHGRTAPRPIPQAHPWSTVETCAVCHQAAPVSAARAAASASEPARSIVHTLKGLGDCLACHGESAPMAIPPDHPWSTNETCAACHQPDPQPVPMPKSISEPALSIIHTLRGLDDCLVCHGESGPRAIPRDHPWSTLETCAVCHQPDPQPAPMPESMSEPALSIVHTLKGLDDCMVCHGESGPRAIPRDHPWSTLETCAACHQPDPQPIPLPESMSEPALSIIHALKGLGDCLVCHGPSAPQAFSRDHPWSTLETCAACHQPDPDPDPQPTSTSDPAPSILHTVRGLNDCLLCHGTSAPMPFDPGHGGRTNDLCLLCHEALPVSAPPPSTPPPAPALPHSIAGREDCLVCHGGASVIPFPPNHAGRTNDLCLFCHSP